MNDKVMAILPDELQAKLKRLLVLEGDGWSESWNELAASIVLELNYLRDDNLITKKEWDYIREKYLKSIGNMNENNSNFLNFIMSSNKEV